MNSVLNVQDIDTMSSCSWNTEKSMLSAAEKSRGGGGAMLADHQPRSPSSNQTKYPIKTLCFSKKSLTMPTKEEYSILLTCGLGARKWQVSLDFDEEAFQSAIYKIYPRLTSVSSYTLWNIKKDKTFEKLPAKVNTPSRIRAYLGNQFSGCLLIMPSEEIQLFDQQLQNDLIHNQNMKQLSQKTNSFNEKPKPVSPFNEQIHNEMRLFHNTPEKSKRYHGSNHGSNQSVTFDIPEQKLETVSEMIEKNASNNRNNVNVNEGREPPPPQLRHLSDQVMESKIYSGSALSSLQISQHDPISLKRDHTGTGSTVKAQNNFSYPSFSSALDTKHEQTNKLHQSNNRSLQRAFCLVCGKVPKQPNATPFYEVETATLPTANAENNFTSLAKKLREVIKISDSQRNQLVPSKEVCKKCFRSLVDMEFMENQIRKVKEEMMGNFLATVTKVTKMTGVTIPFINPLGENTYTTTSNTIRPSTSTMSQNSCHNLDETRNTPRQTMTSISNLQNQFAVSSASRSVNSMTSNYSWEMGPQPPRQPPAERRRQMERNQQTDNVLYALSRQQPPSTYDNLMHNLSQEKGRRMFEETRGRRMGPTNVGNLPNRSASHDPGGSYLMSQQMNPYPEIPSVPSSNNGDGIGTSNASDSYQIYRRARSSPPRLTDIPPNYIAQIDRSVNAYQIDYNKGGPVNLSSNSSSGNEGHSNSTMTMAAVSAERCTDWVKDSRICVQKNELIKDNHYSIKDVEKTDTTDQGETKSEKRSNYPGGQSSGDDSTAASCGSTPPTVEGSDDSKNSSDTDSPDNDASATMKQDKSKTDEKHHKRVHYQDHKLSAKNIKQHQKINRRLQRSPMKLVQNKSIEFQKPKKSKKVKVAKHHNKESGNEKEASKSNTNGGSDSNGTSDSNGEGNGSNGSSNGNGTSDQWTRSSSNTPSPPTSFGSAGSNDNTSSIDPSSSSTEGLQVMSSHFPKPFWKKRFCEDEASSHQSNDNIQSTINIDETKSKSEDSDTNKSSGSGGEETQQTSPAKRRKLSTGNYHHDDEITEETDLCNANEDVNSRRRKGVKDNSSSETSSRTVSPNERSNAISTDSGHESRGSD